VEQLVVDDDPGATPRRLEEDPGGEATRDADPVPGQRTEVRVILDVHGAGEMLLGDPAGVHTDPPRAGSWTTGRRR
jgi:hypothetical protein